jgi:predicted ATP-dependent endonuclease of OLD family
MDLKNISTPLLIGENGSGKSNLLEAILIIFKTLYTFNFDECNFDFEISLTSRNNRENTFKKRDNEITIYNDFNLTYGEIFKEKKKYIETVFQFGFLPDNIFVYYLGDNKRLYSIAKSISRSNKTIDIVKYRYNNNSIVILENEVQLAALISMHLKKMDLSFDFSIEEVSISIQHSQFDIFKKSILNEFVSNVVSSKSGSDYITLVEKSNINVSIIELTHAIIDLINANVLSRFLELNRYPIDVKLRVNNNNADSELINFRELSEGEQNKVIMSTFASVFNGRKDNCIFLFDEPDAFFNPKWQNNLVSWVKELTDNQLFIASHSSNILSRINNESIFYFNDGQVSKLNERVYGRDIRFIQQYIQNVPRFPDEVQQLVDNFFRNLESLDISNANKYLVELREIFGSTDPYLTELETIYGFIVVEQQ